MSVGSSLIRVRERGFLDQVDLALVVIRRRPLPIALAAAAGIVPIGLIDAWIASRAAGSGVLLLWFVLFQVPWATAPLTVVLGGLMFGSRPSAGAVVRAVARALPGMIVYQGLVRGLCFLTFVVSPLAVARYAFVDEILLLERGPVRSVNSRSGDLTGSQGVDFLGRALASIVLGYLFVLSFRFGMGVLIDSLTGTFSMAPEEPGVVVGEDGVPWIFDLGGPLAMVGIGLAVGFFGVVRFLAYIDRRIRLEGWEIELKIRAVGQAMGAGR